MKRARWVVYWLVNGACRDPKRHGYVGATGRLWQRLAAHRTAGRLVVRFAKGCKVKILFRGSRRAALALEKRLRPKRGIGWNIGVGGYGNGAGTKGIPKSPEHRAKQRAAALRRYADPAEHERTARAVRKGLKGIDRSGPNNSRYGVKLTEATKEKIRQRALERDMSGANNPNYRHGNYVED